MHRSLLFREPSFLSKSISNSAVPASPTTVIVKEALNPNIRTFSLADIHKQHILGRGTFAKCFFGCLGPINVCIKEMRVSSHSVALMIKEANIMIQCCHPNISFLYGVCEHQRRNMLILSFHGVDTQSYSLHSILWSKKEHHNKLEVSDLQWKSVLVGVISAIDHLHHLNILHNDIKEDNVVLDVQKGNVKPIVIDFGKACQKEDGRKYSLSYEQIKVYKTKHPHIAPDLRDGLCCQSEATDIYSFGRILLQKHFKIPFVSSLSNECLIYDSIRRPSTKELYTSIINMFTN